jgi:hypothetical protein
MKKQKNLPFVLSIISMFFFINGMGCVGQPKKTINIKNEIATIIPFLREDVSLVIDKLEIIRLGLSEKNKISMTRHGNMDSYQIKIYSYNYNGNVESFYLEERLEVFSVEIINSINYLLLNNELQLERLHTNFDLKYSRMQADFSEIIGSYMYYPTIYYFDPKDHVQMDVFLRMGAYLEELERNYWLVVWYRK